MNRPAREPQEAPPPGSSDVTERRTWPGEKQSLVKRRDLGFPWVPYRVEPFAEPVKPPVSRLVDIWLRLPELSAGEPSIQPTVSHRDARVVRAVCRMRYEGAASS